MISFTDVYCGDLEKVGVPKLAKTMPRLCASSCCVQPRLLLVVEPHVLWCALKSLLRMRLSVVSAQMPRSRASRRVNRWDCMYMEATVSCNFSSLAFTATYL